MNITLIILTNIFTILLISTIYKKLNYPTLIDMIKEIYITNIINYIRPFKDKGISAIIYYSYFDKLYNLSVRYKGDRITGSYISIKIARKQFRQIVEDISISEQYERIKQKQVKS